MITAPRSAFRPATALIALVALTIAGCSKPDQAALTAGDAALKGQLVGGVITPVAVRPVKIGLSGPTRTGCGTQLEASTGTLSIYWAPVPGAPAKARTDAAVIACEVEGGWTGVVFAADGQSLGSCNVDRAIRHPIEYQGPCRSGWIETAKAKAAG